MKKTGQRAEQKPIEVFEEEEIKALWHKEDHQKTIPEGVEGYRHNVCSFYCAGFWFIGEGNR